MSKRHGTAGEPASQFFSDPIAGDGTGEALPPIAKDPLPRIGAARPGGAFATAVLGVGVVVKVAYHAGPPHITFLGRLWYRGKPQEIPEADWDAMRKRPDFGPFEFRIV